MIFIKKIFINLSLFAFITLIIICSLILGASKGFLDKQVKQIIEFYLDRKNLKIQIGDLQIRNNFLSIDKISMDLANNTRSEITNFKINLTINGLITRPLIHSKVNIDNLTLVSKDEQHILDVKISVNHNVDLFKNKIETQLNFVSIKNINLLDSYGNIFPNGEGVCFYKSKFSINTRKSANCKLAFGDKSYLFFNIKSDGSLIQANGNIENIPIMIYQIVKKIIPNNSVMLFLQESIKGGYVRNGEFNVNLDYNSLAENILSEEMLKAKLHVVDIEYTYDKDFPALKKIDSNINISGSSVKFLFNQAYSGESLISGIMTFDWQGMDKSNFIFNATAQGPAVDMIDFILNDDYDKIKKQGIDLKKITGQANSKINLIIPISPDIKNSYDVSTIITRVNGKAFSDKIILQNAKITGTFDGNKVIAQGVGKINNYNSNFTYQYNITDNNDDYKYLLNVKTTILAEKQKIGILKLISGSNILNFEYKEQKDGVSLIKASSNLKNLEFYIGKISIFKKLYNDAQFTLTGKLYNNLKGDINFNLLGENNLEITGKVKIQNNKYDITMPVINYGITNLIGKIILGQDDLKAEIQGNQLDLSESSMMQFLEKEGDPRDINLNINVDKIKLKNNIWLNNVKLQINCDKVKCFSGFLDSKIGTRYFKMLLTDRQDTEQWIISCNNAGALFKGIGMYNNVRSGTINLTLDTKRHEVKKGEVIPILDGTFDLKNFVATDISFLTKIVSFVSFPGLISSVVNNKNIMFNHMTGKFNYIGDTIKIVDAEATGLFFDFTMQGTINTNTHKIRLKGNVVPSFFFVSKIPIIGKIFSKVAPYSVNLEYKE